MDAPEGWLQYADWRGEQGSVVGRVLVRPRVRNDALANDRHVLVYLPPSLDRGNGDRRFPVLYMHDGQNLFDAASGPGAEWQIDETMEALSAEGVEAIVVGIPNARIADPPLDTGRALEYSRHPHPQRGGGGADDYLGFLERAVKPLIDRDFPTDPHPAATGIAGSSLGGMISLYALIARPDVFGLAGVMSPAFWFDGGRLLAKRAPALRPGARIYIDVGGREGSHEPVEAERAEMSRRYVDDARTLANLLRANGFRDGEDLLYVEDPEAVHHETAWAKRSPDMLRFLLAPWRR